MPRSVPVRMSRCQSASMRERPERSERPRVLGWGPETTSVPDPPRKNTRCLPLNRPGWAEELRSQRKQYARFVQELILKPPKNVTQGRRGGYADASLLRTFSGSQGLVSRQASTGGAGHEWEAAPHRGAPGPTERSRAVHVRPIAGAPPPSEPPDGADGHSAAIPMEESAAGSVGLAGAGSGPDAPARTEGVGSADDGIDDDAERDLLEAEDASHEGVAPAGRAPYGRSPSMTQGLRPTDDDPLSDKESSGWAALWSDKELMQAIEQDVVRTMPDLAFYADGGRGSEDEEDEDSCADGDGRGGGKGGSHGGDGDDGGDDGAASVRRRARGERRRLGRERHLAIARILFVHAKLNPAESYTQGMNEIVATLYFVLATHSCQEWRRHAEADTFFCFTNLMAEIRDVFIQSMDDSESGLQGKMQAFSDTLQQHDPELAEHMVSSPFGRGRPGVTTDLRPSSRLAIFCLEHQHPSASLVDASKWAKTRHRLLRGTRNCSAGSPPAPFQVSVPVPSSSFHLR